MRFQLDIRTFEVFKKIDFSEMTSRPVIDKVNDDFYIIVVQDDLIKEVQGCINDSIVGIGMDNQDTVNEIGQILYWIYDDIYDQKKELDND